MDKPVILCVDDDKSLLLGLRDELKLEFGAMCSIEVAVSYAEALEIVAQQQAVGIELAVILADQQLNGDRGDDLLVAVHQRSPDTCTIMLTGQADAEAVGHALNEAGLFRFLTKPWKPEALLAAVRSGLDAYLERRSRAQRADRLAEVAAVQEQLLAASTPHQLWTEALTALQQLTRTECLMLVDSAGHLQAFVHEDGELPPDMQEPLPEASLWSRAGSDVYTVEHLQSDPAWGTESWLVNRRMRSLLILPLGPERGWLVGWHTRAYAFFTPLRVEVMGQVCRFVLRRLPELETDAQTQASEQHQLDELLRRTAALEAESEELQRLLSGRMQEIEALQLHLLEAQQQLESLRSAHETSSRSASELNEACDRLTTQIASQEQVNAVLKSELELMAGNDQQYQARIRALEQSLEQQQAELETTIQARDHAQAEAAHAAALEEKVREWEQLSQLLEKDQQGVLAQVEEKEQLIQLLRSQLADEQEQLRVHQTEVTRLQSQNEHFASQLADGLQRLDTARREALEAQRELRETENELTALRKQHQELADENSRLKMQVADLKPLAEAAIDMPALREQVKYLTGEVEKRDEQLEAHERALHNHTVVEAELNRRLEESSNEAARLENALREVAGKVAAQEAGLAEAAQLLAAQQAQTVAADSLRQEAELLAESLQTEVQQRETERDDARARVEQLEQEREQLKTHLFEPAWYQPLLRASQRRHLLAGAFPQCFILENAGTTGPTPFVWLAEVEDQLYLALVDHQLEGQLEPGLSQWICLTLDALLAKAPIQQCADLLLQLGTAYAAFQEEVGPWPELRITLTRWDLDEAVLHYTSTGHTLWMQRGNELTELAPDADALALDTLGQNLVNHSIALEPDDSFYLSSVHSAAVLAQRLPQIMKETGPRQAVDLQGALAGLTHRGLLVGLTV